MWSAGDVAYRLIGDRHLAAIERSGGDTFVVPPISTEFDVDPRLVVPPEERDVAFRMVTIHRDALGAGAEAGPRWKLWKVVGTYDPTCLTGFDPLAGGALETYSYPAVRLPDGHLLPPNRAMAGYVNTSPLALTTLDGAAWLADPAHYRGQPGAAFIGAIRIAADSAATPSQDAYRDLVALSQEIEAATNLDADVVKGGSPEPVAVDLPAGRFGRPALTVTEGWSKEGVAATISEGVAAQDALFGGIAVIALVGMVGLIFWVSAESRREELAWLRSFGWSASDINAMLSWEYTLIGLGAGAMIGVATWLLRSVLGIPSPLFVLVGAAAPLAIGAGIGRLATRLAGRSITEGLDTGGRDIRRASRRPTISRIAFAELWYGQPRLSLLVCAGLAVGVFLLGATVLIAMGFGGRLQVTALDQEIRFQVAPFHWWMTSIVLITGVLGVGQAAELAFDRRRSRLALLRSLGWSRTDLAQLQLTQAAIIGVVSAVVPAVAILATGTALGDPGHGVLVSAAIFLVALAVAGVASLRTTIRAYGTSVGRGLAEG
jgi:putative ABC transport system permease protein